MKQYVWNNLILYSFSVSLPFLVPDRSRTASLFSGHAGSPRSLSDKLPVSVSEQPSCYRFRFPEGAPSSLDGDHVWLLRPPEKLFIIRIIRHMLAQSNKNLIEDSNFLSYNFLSRLKQSICNHWYVIRLESCNKTRSISALGNFINQLSFARNDNMSKQK